MPIGLGVYFLLTTAGISITLLLVEGEVFNGLRTCIPTVFLKKLVTCFSCLSVWTSFGLLSTYYVWPEQTLWVATGFSLHFSCYILFKSIKLLDKI